MKKIPIIVRQQYRYKIEECLDLIKRLPEKEAEWYISFLRMYYGRSKEDAAKLGTELKPDAQSNYVAESFDIMTMRIRKEKNDL